MEIGEADHKQFMYVILLSTNACLNNLLNEDKLTPHDKALINCLCLKIKISSSRIRLSKTKSTQRINVGF